MTRVTRATSKARTRERLIAEARRLFRDRGYAATSLEQIAEAADVTKGAIYGHFSSKEDLLLTAIEAAPNPDYGILMDDLSRPLRERLAEFGHAIAVDKATADKAGLAVSLEFVAAMLRSPETLRRYGADFERRLAELAAADDEQPLPDVTVAEVWSGHNWTVQPTPNPANPTNISLAAVSCRSPRFCAAVGSNSAILAFTLVEVWNGTDWRLRSSPSVIFAGQNALNGVSCGSGVGCTAVGVTDDPAQISATLVETGD